MAQLGFTFYPKDWWTSDSFFLLQPYERYIYLECIFIMYSQDGWISNNKLIIERRLSTTIKDEVWCKITDLFVKDGDMLTHKSVNSRLKKTIANRENGKKGGAPMGNANATKQPKQPNETTQNNPPLERERESESEKETEEEEKAPPPEKENLNFPEGFSIVWKDWIDFKKELKDNYKTVKSEQAALDKLAKLANDNAETAKLIVAQSIEREWKGLFALKEDFPPRKQVQDNLITSKRRKL